MESVIHLTATRVNSLVSISAGRDVGGAIPSVRFTLADGLVSGMGNSIHEEVECSLNLALARRCVCHCICSSGGVCLTMEAIGIAITDGVIDHLSTWNHIEIEISGGVAARDGSLNARVSLGHRVRDSESVA